MLRRSPLERWKHIAELLPLASNCEDSRETSGAPGASVNGRCAKFSQPWKPSSVSWRTAAKQPLFQIVVNALSPSLLAKRPLHPRVAHSSSLMQARPHPTRCTSTSHCPPTRARRRALRRQRSASEGVPVSLLVGRAGASHTQSARAETCAISYRKFVHATASSARVEKRR